MPARIARKRLINRKTTRNRPVDPAQSGNNYARLSEDGRLTITAGRNEVVFRAAGVLAARWEDEETILLVIREEEEDDPVAVRAFRPRAHREWDTEDAHAQPHLSPDGAHVALALELPNPAVAALPSGRVARDFLAHANLAGAPSEIKWLPENGGLEITAAPSILQWTPGRNGFLRKSLPA